MRDCGWFCCVVFCQAPCLTFHGVSDVAGGTQGPVSALRGQLGQQHTAQLIGGGVSLKKQQQLT